MNWQHVSYGYDSKKIICIFVWIRNGLVDNKIERSWISKWYEATVYFAKKYCFVIVYYRETNTWLKLAGFCSRIQIISNIPNHWLHKGKLLQVMSINHGYIGGYPINIPRNKGLFPNFKERHSTSKNMVTHKGKCMDVVTHAWQLNWSCYPWECHNSASWAAVCYK